MSSRIDLRGAWAVADTITDTLRDLHAGTFTPNAKATAQRTPTDHDDTRIIYVSGLLVKTSALAQSLRAIGIDATAYNEIQDALIETPPGSTALLSINSPGGAAQGLRHIGDILHENRNKIEAIAIDELAASAAWLIACAPAKPIIALQPDAIVCNMGIRLIQYIMNEEREVVDTASPAKANTDSKDGRQAYQQLCDDLAEPLYAQIDRGGRTATRTLRGAPITAERAHALSLVDHIGAITIT